MESDDNTCLSLYFEFLSFVNSKILTTISCYKTILNDFAMLFRGLDRKRTGEFDNKSLHSRVIIAGDEQFN